MKKGLLILGLGWLAFTLLANSSASDANVWLAVIPVAYLTGVVLLWSN